MHTPECQVLQQNHLRNSRSRSSYQRGDRNCPCFCKRKRITKESVKEALIRFGYFITCICASVGIVLLIVSYFVGDSTDFNVVLMDWGIDVVPFCVLLLLIASVTPLVDQIFKMYDETKLAFKHSRGDYVNV